MVAVTGEILVGLVGLLCVSYMWAQSERRGRFEPRIQLLELLALATRRGVSLVDVLERAAIGQPRRMNRMFTALASELDQGTGLADALGQVAYDHIPPANLAAIAAADGSAQLPAVLASLAEQADDRASAEHTFAKMLSYPAMLAALFVMLHGWMAVAILPVLSALPFPNGTATASSGTTQFLGVSMGTWQIVVLQLLVVAVCAHRMYEEVPVVRRWFRRWWARVPLLTRSGRLLAAGNFLDLLSRVLTAGVALPVAIRRCAAVTGSRRLEADLGTTADAFDEGHESAVAWRRSGLPEFAVVAATAAANSGRERFAEVLQRAGQECRRRGIRRRERLLVMWQPACLLVVGAMLASEFIGLMTITARVQGEVMLW